MAGPLTSGGGGGVTILDATGAPVVDAHIAARSPIANNKRAELRLGGGVLPGVLRVLDRGGDVTATLDGFNGGLSLGGRSKNGQKGSNGSISLYDRDGANTVQVNSGTDRADVFLGEANKPARILLTTGGNPGPTISVDGTCNALQFLAKGSNVDAVAEVSGLGRATFGGFGHNGSVSVRGADGQPLAELLGRDTESVIGVGQANRPGRISVYGPKGEAVRIDGATGDVVLGNADCAEEFDVVDAGIEPGTVVVRTDDGALAPSEKPYDRRVAGVVSGAGSFRPALVLDRRDTGRARAPVALVGKVYCLADADEDPIGVGDLLATSETPGHAMRADDPGRAFGAVLGKALAPLPSGRGLLPILVASQ